MKSILRTLAGLAVLFSCATVAQAQLFRAYVAPTGSDANPCTIVAPCRLLPAALAAVANGGEIWMLGSANYNTGMVNVNKSVTLLAIPGVVGSIVAASAPALNIATPGVDVVLRNLVIVPLVGSAPTQGIVMTAGSSLAIEGSVIANIPGDALTVATAARVSISGTSIRGNAGHGINLGLGAQASVTRVVLARNQGSGVYINLPAEAPALTTAVDVIASTIDGHQEGVTVINESTEAKARASIRSSLLTRGARGISVMALGTDARVLASNNTVTQFVAAGIEASGGYVVAMGNTVTDNGTGFVRSEGTFETRSDNVVRGNGTDKVGTFGTFLGD